jgi:ABC-type transporter MlaC component
MSTIIILSPILYPAIIGGWPVITAAVTAAAVGLGLNVKEKVHELNKVEVAGAVEVEVDVHNSEVLTDSVVSGKELVLTSKEGIVLRVTRNERGQCKVCAYGKGFSKAELKVYAEEFTQKIVQCYSYNRTLTELKNKEFQMIDEEVLEDGSIRLHVRRWVD